MRFLLILFSLFCSIIALGQANKYAKRSLTLVDLLNDKHVTPIHDMDTLSGRSFGLLLEKLDRNKIYFNKKDIELLEKHKFSFLEEFKNQDFSFFIDLESILKSRLSSSLEYMNTVNNNDLWEHQSNRYYEETVRTYAPDEPTRQTELKAYIKSYCFENVYNTYSSDSTFNLNDHGKKAFNKEANSVLGLFQCRVDKRINGVTKFEDYIGNHLLNAIAKSFDPHSSYFTQKQREQFELHLATNAESFGISFEENEDGSFSIGHLSPGGSAWNSRVLTTGMELLSAQWKSGKTIDLDCTSDYEINMELNTHTENEIKFIFTDSKNKKIPCTLFKSEIKVDDNTIKSFVIKEKKSIGYIAIPSFYTDDTFLSSEGCSNDVAKEILKLKREKIDGLIIDLRYNGGGSMLEAIKLSGLFINEGPLFSHETTGEEKPRLYKDLNRGLSYRGPLVILINEYSASASEIVASTLQDYNRALIVGADSYGKATSQYITPLLVLDDSGGSVKVTNGKLFSITGSTHQINRVKVDIPLPSFLAIYDELEAFEPYALEFSKAKRTYNYTSFTPIKVDSINKLQQKRMGQIQEIVRLTEIIDSISNETGNFGYKLNLKGAYSAYVILNNPYEEYDSLAEYNSGLTIQNNQYDSPVLQMDRITDEVNKNIIKNLKSDFIIDQTYYIIQDLINSN